MDFLCPVVQKRYCLPRDLIATCCITVCYVCVIFFYFNFIFLSGSVKRDTTHAHMFYLNLPRVVSNDEPQQDDSGQADQTLQGQRVHGAL